MLEWLKQLSDGADGAFKNGLTASLVTMAVIVALAVVIDFILTRAFRRASGRRPENRTQLNFIRKMLRFVVVILACFGVLSQFKPFNSVVVSLLAGSGVAVLVIGLAAQETMGNLIAGFFLSMSRPFSIGDRITLTEKGITGFVEDITLRHTVIKTFENTRVIIPNSVINQAIIDNAKFMEEKTCAFLDFSVSYESDTRLAMQIISSEVERHPLFTDPRTDAQRSAGESAAPVRLVALGDSSVTLRCGVWCRSAGECYAASCDLRLSVKERFSQEGIEIPYPHRTVVMKDK